jgi:hypothetical protein
MTARELSLQLSRMDFDMDVCIKVNGVTYDLDKVEYDTDDDGEKVILIRLDE